MEDRIERIAERFTAIAREGEVEKAVDYFECEAVFDCGERRRPAETDELRVPPMNELYKGLKD